MNETFSIPTISLEKTDVLVQKTLTNQMIKDMKILKNRVGKRYNQRNNLNSFHHNSLKTTLTNNNRYHQILNSYQSFNSDKSKLIPPLKLYNSFRDTTISNNTLSFHTLNSTFHNNNRNKFFMTLSKSKRTRNNRETLNNFNSRSYSIRKGRFENLREFLSKTRKIFYENYFLKHMKKEYNLIKEEKEIAVDLMRLEIFNYQRMLKYIRIYINDTDEYINYLNKKIEEEKEKKDNLWDKRNEVLHETYLLRYRFGRVQRVYEINLDNKFFLLCVKNGTKILNNFTEDDQRDYYADCNTLYLISNFNHIQSKMAKKKTISVKGREKRYSVLEENMSEGVKIIRQPKPIFDKPEDFKKKLDLISYRIQKSLILYNEKQKELTILRNEFKRKMEELEKEDELDKYFNEELNMVLKKLGEVKYKNEYLNNYLLNIPNNSKDNSIDLIDKKVKEIHKGISNREEFLKRPIKNYGEKINTLSRLLDIEDKINFLIDFNNEQKKKNYVNYMKVKRNLEIILKDKANELAKLKKEDELKKKQKKVEEKNSKLIIKPNKKVPEFFNFNKPNKIKAKTPIKKITYSFI